MYSEKCMCLYVCIYVVLTFIEKTSCCMQFFRTYTVKIHLLLHAAAFGLFWLLYNISVPQFIQQPSRYWSFGSFTDP